MIRQLQGRRRQVNLNCLQPQQLGSGTKNQQAHNKGAPVEIEVLVKLGVSRPAHGFVFIAFDAAICSALIKAIRHALHIRVTGPQACKEEDMESAPGIIGQVELGRRGRPPEAMQAKAKLKMARSWRGHVADDVTGKNQECTAQDSTAAQWEGRHGFDDQTGKLHFQYLVSAPTQPFLVGPFLGTMRVTHLRTS
eukprot:1154719-Pelagomonas_calceolata.AAC.2